MPSPFPGMDPWLERPMLFPDLHGSLAFLMKEALNSALPDGYVAVEKNRVWIEESTRREPDVRVLDTHGRGDPHHGNSTTATLLARSGMLAMAFADEDETREEPFVEIYASEGERLVTAVEILSLSNKEVGSGRREYLRKQKEFLSSGTNLVEIDLLRGGQHTTMVSRRELRLKAPCDYHVCVSLAATGERLVAPIRMMDPLPRIGIPLDEGVPPVFIELQPLLDRVYDSGRYAKLAKYGDVRPEPRLTPVQQEWAEAILREKKLIP